MYIKLEEARERLLTKLAKDSAELSEKLTLCNEWISKATESSKIETETNASLIEKHFEQIQKAVDERKAYLLSQVESLLAPHSYRFI